MLSPRRLLLAWALPVSRASFGAADIASFRLITELVVIETQRSVVSFLLEVVVLLVVVVSLEAVVVAVIAERATATL